MSPQRGKRLRKNALGPWSPSKIAVPFVDLLSQQASNFGQKNVALKLGRTFEQLEQLRCSKILGEAGKQEIL